MAEYEWPRIRLARALPAIVSVGIVGCGNTGDLYLPRTDAAGEVVTRPAPAPPPDPAAGTNSPRTIDTPATPASPAPEVTEPEEEDPEAAARPRK